MAFPMRCLFFVNESQFSLPRIARTNKHAAAAFFSLLFLPKYKETVRNPRRLPPPPPPSLFNRIVSRENVSSFLFPPLPLALERAAVPLLQCRCGPRVFPFVGGAMSEPNGPSSPFLSFRRDYSGTFLFPRLLSLPPPSPPIRQDRSLKSETPPKGGDRQLFSSFSPLPIVFLCVGVEHVGCRL